jgi:hypothetical protein
MFIHINQVLKTQAKYIYIYYPEYKQLKKITCDPQTIAPNTFNSSEASKG